MIDNIAEGFEPLFAQKALMPVSEIQRNPLLIPDVGGIYTWWFRGTLPEVPLDNTLEINGYRLLYVGVAPSTSNSSSTLRRRIVRDHLGRRMATSTLRRSLAVLLAKELDLEISRSQRGKLVMSNNDECRLTAWLAEWAAVSFLANHAPWQIEDLLIQTGPALPLNIKGSKHPFRHTLGEMRKTIRKLTSPRPG